MSSSNISLRRKIKSLTKSLNKNIKYTVEVEQDRDKHKNELEQLKTNHILNKDASEKIKNLEKTLNINIQYIKKMKEEHQTKTKRLELTIKTLTNKLNDKQFLNNRLDKIKGNNSVSRSINRDVRRSVGGGNININSSNKTDIRRIL